MSTSASRRSHAKEKEKLLVESVDIVNTASEEEESDGGPQLVGKLEVICGSDNMKDLKEA